MTAWEAGRDSDSFCSDLVLLDVVSSFIHVTAGQDAGVGLHSESLWNPTDF